MNDLMKKHQENSFSFSICLAKRFFRSKIAKSIHRLMVLAAQSYVFSDPFRATGKAAAFLMTTTGMMTTMITG